MNIRLPLKKVTRLKGIFNYLNYQLREKRRLDEQELEAATIVISNTMEIWQTR